MTVAADVVVGDFVKYVEEPRYLRVTGFLDRGEGTLIICLDSWGQTLKVNPLEVTDHRKDDEVDDEGNLIEED